MKRGFAVLFLALFLVNSAGIYLYFTIRVISIRQDMMAELRDTPVERLLRLEIEPSAYREVISGDHEIRIQGRYYDIAHTEKVDGKIIVYCLFDEAESNLTAFLERVVDAEEGDAVPGSVSQFLQLVYVAPPTIAIMYVQGPEIKATRAHDAIYTCFLTIEPPPPRG